MDKEIIFTICSNNYISYANALGNSLKFHNPNHRLYVGLIDIVKDKSIYDDINIIPVADVVDPKLLNILSDRYNIKELCTAVKPIYFLHFFIKLGAKKVIYLDPDILIYNSFDELLSLLTEHSIIVTPHFNSPPEEGSHPSDLAILGAGVYNLGFLASAHTEESINFMTWWKRKLITHSYAHGGMFYDQLWVNYVTCFCGNAFVLRNPGYNVANWNLHERNIQVKNEIYFVNGNYPLIFFHFSNYNIDTPDIIASYNNRYTLANRPDVRSLFNDYTNQLKNSGIENLKLIKSPFGRKQRNRNYFNFRNYIKKAFNLVLGKFIN